VKWCKHIAFTFILSLGLITLKARTNEYQTNEYITASFQDSILAGDKDSYIVNQLSIRNNDIHDILLQVKIDVPLGWQIVSHNTFEIKLAPSEIHNLAIAIIKLPSATSSWQPVRVSMRGLSCDYQQEVQFFIAVKERSSVTINPLHPEVILQGKENKVDLTFHVKNNGNCTDTFMVNISNYYLQIEKTQKIVLPPNKDTTITLSHQVSAAQITAVEKNIVQYMISSRKGGQSSNNLNILKSASSRKKMHEFAYKSMQLEAESGIISYNGQVSYYGTLQGKMDANNGRNLDFNYRTRQYGPNSDLQKDVFLVNYRSQKATASVGVVCDAKYFISNGKGVNLSYTFKRPVTVHAAAIVSDHFYKKFGNTYLAGIKYQVGKLSVLQEAALNNNPVYGTKDVVLVNELVLAKKKGLAVSLKGGLGKEINQNKIGRSWGYSIEWQKNKLSVLSKIAQTDLTFPGLTRGLNNHNHSIKLGFKKLSLGAFYQEYSILLNPFRDTVFNSDALSINSKRLGFSSAYSSKKINLTLSVGDLQGTQQSSAITTYKFAELQSNYNISNDIRFQLSSINGYSSQSKFKEKPTWFTSSTVLLNTKYGGVRTFYNRIPFLKRDTSEVVDRIVETMNFSPYLTLKLFKSLLVNLHYDTFKTLEDKELSSNINGKLVYRNRSSNTNLELTGAIPIKESKSNFFGLSGRFFTLTLKKTFNVPVPFKKKYYSLKLNLYKDNNNNGVRDDGDSPVKDYLLTISDKLFKTDVNGQIQYRHMDTGKYKLVARQTIKQAVPVGLPDSITIKKDNTINVPFLSSKSITGNINIIIDSLSNLKFSAANIKVTATENNGLSYSAIADRNGEFIVNVPSGIYTVFLNPNAFAASPYKPDAMSFIVNLKDVATANVSFVVRQQKRQIRLLKN
jgi:hypothetical protein